MFVVLMLDFILRFLAMAELKRALFCSFGLTKTLILCQYWRNELKSFLATSKKLHRSFLVAFSLLSRRFLVALSFVFRLFFVRSSIGLR
ncbi:hypothetical protein CIK88_03710 [Prevotella sp. P5-50]|nr:hypothetical protein CIK88_03710 [Prevotella sp. P5-50]